MVLSRACNKKKQDESVSSSVGQLQQLQYRDCESDENNLNNSIKVKKNFSIYEMIFNIRSFHHITSRSNNISSFWNVVDQSKVSVEFYICVYNLFF